MKINGPHYQIIVNGDVIDSYIHKDAAIAEAKDYAEEYGEVSVVFQEVSGTYRSSTQVWPTRGETYAS